MESIIDQKCDEISKKSLPLTTIQKPVIEKFFEKQNNQENICLFILAIVPIGITVGLIEGCTKSFKSAQAIGIVTSGSLIACGIAVCIKEVSIKAGKKAGGQNSYGTVFTGFGNLFYGCPFQCLGIPLIITSMYYGMIPAMIASYLFGMLLLVPCFILSKKIVASFKLPTVEQRLLREYLTLPNEIGYQKCGTINLEENNPTYYICSICFSSRIRRKIFLYNLNKKKAEIPLILNL